MADDYLSLLSPNDLAGFNQNVMANDPYGLIGRSLAEWQPNYSTFNAGQSALTAFGKAFMGGLLQNYSQNRAADQLSKTVGVLPQLAQNPYNVAAPEGVDAGAFNMLRGSAILGLNQRAARQKDLNQKFGSDLMLKVLGEKASSAERAKEEVIKAFSQNAVKGRKALDAYNTLYGPTSTQPVSSTLQEGEVNKNTQALKPALPSSEEVLQANVPDSNIDPLGLAKKRQQLLELYEGDEDRVNAILDRDLETAQLNKKDFDKYLIENQAQLDKTGGFVSSIEDALKGAGQTGGVPYVEELGRSALLRGQAMFEGAGSDAAKRLGARKDLDSLAVLGAAELKTALKDTQMSEKEFEKYLGASESTSNIISENQAIFGRRKRLYDIAQQRQDFLRKANQEGLSLPEGQQAFRNFEKLVPISKDGDLNPERLTINIESLSPRDLLANKYEAAKKETSQVEEQISPVSSAVEPSWLDRVVSGSFTRPDGSVVPLDQMTEEEKQAVQSETESPLRKILTAVLQGANSATLNKLPYMLAPLQAGYAEAKDLVGLGENKSFGENVSQNVARNKEVIAANEKEFPGVSLAAQTGGAIVSPINKVMGPLMGAGKATTLGGKLLNVLGRRAPVVAGVAAVQAAGDGDMSEAAEKGAMASIALDTLGGAVGKMASIAPSVLNKAYGVFKSDYNAVAKNFSAKNIDKIKNSVDNGLNLIKSEAGVTAKEAFKNNEDFYTDMFRKAEEAITKRTSEVDAVVDNIGQVIPKQKLDAGKILKNMTLRPEQRSAVENKINELVKANNAARPGGFLLREINDLKRLYNPLYKYNPESADDVAMAGFIDYLRGHVENTVENLAAKGKLIDKAYSGYIRKLNDETKDLINVKNIYGKKIPGARAEEVVSSVRQSLYTTGGAAVPGAKTVGEAVAGELGGRVAPVIALATASNRALRPVLQSFIDNQEVMRGLLSDPRTRTAITQMMLDEGANPSQLSEETNLSSIPAETILQKKNFKESIGPRMEKIPASHVIEQIKQDPVDHAIMLMESGGDPNAKNPDSSASGLFQLIKKTAGALGVKDVFDPAQNYEGYKKLKAAAIKNFGSDDPATIYAAHYLGEPTMRKWLSGEALTDEQEKQVAYLQTVLLPRLQKIYAELTGKDVVEA